MEKISKRHATMHLSPMTCKSHWRGAAMRGFTLIELMVVLVIIAIIAAIAIPSYQAYARGVATSQAQQEMQKTLPIEILIQIIFMGKRVQ